MGCRLLCAQNVFRRSANRTNANNVWYSNTSGNVNTTNTSNANRCAPGLYGIAVTRSAHSADALRNITIHGAECPAEKLNNTAMEAWRIQ